MNSCPLVMCLTNHVASEFTADVLLAVGARPAMVEEASEAAELADKADAVLVNLGTVHPRQAEAIRAALSALGPVPTTGAAVPGPVPTTGAGPVPWVLDPVACHLLAYRRELALELISLKPTLIRGNRAEISFLLGFVPEKMGPVPTLSTGETDEIYAPGTSASGWLPWKTVAGGVAMLQSVTATGCVQGAVCAALLGKGMSPLAAAESASRLMKRAGEIAWERAKSPGSFKVALIDALYGLSKGDLL